MSSKIDESIDEWRDRITPMQRSVDGFARWMAVSLTADAEWQVTGHLMIDRTTRETRRAPVFSGIGFYARPAAGHKVDALVVFPGGSANPVIVATRDEDARKAIADLAQDESAMFNSAVIIVCKANGTVEIRTAGGAALALPTLADYNALRAAFNSHTHVYSPGPGTPAPTAAPASPVGSPTGTQVLKAQ